MPAKNTVALAQQAVNAQVAGPDGQDGSPVLVIVAAVGLTVMMSALTQHIRRLRTLA